MKIKVGWKNHDLYKAGLIEMVPTNWVYNHWGTDVTPQAELLDGTPADLDELWENILQDGLGEPLIMRVGILNNKFRLEAGNHRIQLFHKYGVGEIPVVVQVRERCGPEEADVMTDATHNFNNENELLISEITNEYMKPSEVFRSLSKNSSISAQAKEDQTKTTYGVDVSSVRADNLDKKMIKHISSLESPKVLDLACGAGGQSLRLATAGAEVTAVDDYDYSVVFNNIREDNNLMEERLQFMQGDMTNL
ncbi:MAG: ParB N-terminal domain-containing protein, partial [Candidatus Pacebacteria bacterium]|nr:ParB N-terminal domain-containing protein [Candidatus Paceibacterota bacterium]